MALDSAVVYYLCEEHLEIDLSKRLPEHRFNCYHIVDKNLCTLTDCNHQAVMKFVGYKIPETVPANLEFIGKQRFAEFELLDEACKALCYAPALESLTLFLFYKIRVSAIGADVPATKMCKAMAKLILQKLKIQETDTLLRAEVSAILNLLDIYPNDLEGRPLSD